MSEQVGAIHFKANTDELEKASQALDKLAQAGPRAAAAVSSVSNAANTTGKSLKNIGGGDVSKGLQDVGNAAPRAADGLSKTAKSANDARQALEGVKSAGAGIGNVAAGSGKAADGIQSLASAGLQAKNAFDLLQTGVQAFLGLKIVGWAKNTSAALYEASAAAERLKIGLDFASARGSAAEIDYLRKTTYELGLQFSSTAQAYQQFQAAARGTAIEGERARLIFESISKASAVMGLTADQSAGALLALQQMVSKGTVQAEELRGQLGERLPGAFQIAARSMGVTTAALGKMLENGEVLAEDFLPKFAAELTKSLGDAPEKAAERLDATVNRTSDAWERLKQNVGDSGVSDFMAGQMNILADAMGNFNNKVEEARAAGDGFGGQLLAAAGAAVEFINPINAVGYSALEAGNQLKEAEKKLKELKDAGAQKSSNLMLREAYSHAQRLVDKLREAKSVQDALAGVNTSNAPQPLRDREAGNSRGSRANYYQEQFASAQFLASRNDGINKSFISDMEGLAKAYANGAMSVAEYTKAVTEANKKRYESTETGKSELKALKESEKGARSGANAYAVLSQKAADYVKALQLESQQGSKLTQSQKLQIELDNLLATSKGKVNAAAVAGIQASLAIAKAMEGEAVATKRAQEAYQEYLSIQGELADYDVARSKALESARLAMDASETTARESLRRIELEAGLIGASNEKRAVMLAQLEEEIRLEKELAAINALDTTESNREELRKRSRVVSAKNIAVAEGKAYVAEWDKTSQLIGDTLSDYIMGGGKDAATYLKRLFSTLVLQPVVQTLVSGVMGTGAAAASGAGSGIAGAVGSGQSIFSAFSGSLTAGIGGTIASLGASLGASAATAFGSGIAAGGSLGLTAGLSQGASMIGAGAGGTAAGLGTMAGAAMPWVAGALALYSIAKSFDNSGTLHYGAGATYSGGKLQEGASIYNQANFGMGAAGEWNENSQQTVSGIAAALGSALDSFAVGFGEKAGYTVATAFADDSSKDGAWGALRIADAVGNVLVDWENTRSSKWAPREFGDGEQGYKDYLNAVAVDVKSAFLQMDIPGWGKQLVEAATDLDSLSAALAQIGAIKTAFDAIGRSMKSFVDLTSDMQTQLINASGGMEALSGNAASFYESFYTEAERMQNLREQVNASLEKLGVSLGNPLDAFDGESAKEAFRRNFEEAMATGQGELAAAMLALNQDFATAANYAEKLGGAVDGTAGSMRAAIDALSDAAQSALSARSTASSLLGQIGSATGNGYASQREGQLWSAMGSAQGYQQQIDLASELTDLVLGRYEAEKQLLEQNSAIARQTGEQQIAFARQLGDYVQSLMTGSLSPLTNAEKLSQAQQNYQGTLAAAQGGDKVAQGNLQNASSEYLQLARMYFASSDDYTKIFDAVTSQLGNLSAVTMSEGQMQISIAEQSLSVSSSTLGQLGTLQTVLERAYAEADADYTVQTDLLQEQLQAMLGVKGGVEAVTKAIAAMPTELAVLFNGLNKVNGSHANGLSYVPFDGYRAELHKGERVLTAAENSAYRPDFSSYGRGGDAALVAEVKALRAEVAALRSENREDAAMQARATVQASQLNAQEVVQGVGGATERAAYQSNMGVTMR